MNEGTSVPSFHLTVIYLQQRDSSKVPQSFKATMTAPSSGYFPPRLSHQPQTPNWPSLVTQWPLHQPPQPFKFNSFQPQAHKCTLSRTQQMFHTLPPNYNAWRNVFRFPPIPNLPYGSNHKSMSGVSAFTPKVLPPLKSHEMHVNECAPFTIDSYYSGFYREL